MFKKLLLCVLAALALQGGGCFSKPRKLKSPCIRSNESTSCKLYPVNDHWLGKYKVVAQ